MSVELINVIIFSLATLITNNSADESSKNLSIMEAGTSLGYIVGPLIAFSFGYFGYPFPFLVCIIMDFLSIFLIKFNLISDIYMEEQVVIEESSWKNRSFSYDINKKHIFLRKASINYFEKIKDMHPADIRNASESSSTEDDSSSDSDNECDFISEPIKMRKTYHNKYNFIYRERDEEESEDSALDPKGFLLLAISNAILPTFTMIICDYICQTFFAPVFTIVMKRKYGLNEQNSSLILSLMFLCYFISLRFINSLIRLFPVKYLLCFGLLANSMCALLFAPVHSLPQQLWISVLGYCLLNCFAGFISISSIIDLNRSLRLMGYSVDFASDNSSAIYIFGVSLAELFGPTIGGALTSNYGYETTCSFVGALNLILSIIVFCLYFKNIRVSLAQKYKKNFNKDKDKDLNKCNNIINQEGEIIRNSSKFITSEIKKHDSSNILKPVTSKFDIPGDTNN